MNDTCVKSKGRVRYRSQSYIKDMRRSKANATALLVISCLVATSLLSLTDDIIIDHQTSSLEIRRRRRLSRASSSRASLMTNNHHTSVTDSSSIAMNIYPWAEHNLKPIAEPLIPNNETALLFWHVPKSGGTTAKAMYECLGLTLVNRAGSLPQFGHDQDSQLIVFKPWGEHGPAYVNADTSTEGGIIRAEQLGLVRSQLGHVIITSYPQFAVEHLYDPHHTGRAFAIFRHPVDRLISKFYYLQVATWERTYSPNWKYMDINYWATINRDNDVYVRMLAGKKVGDTVNEDDLQLAMSTIKERFVVGLIDDMEESFRRFSIIIGIDKSNNNNWEMCHDKFFGQSMKRSNSNSHETFAEESPEWDAIAQRNALDIRFFTFVQELFIEQKEIIDSLLEYQSSAVPPD